MPPVLDYHSLFWCVTKWTSGIFPDDGEAINQQAFFFKTCRALSGHTPTWSRSSAFRRPAPRRPSLNPPCNQSSLDRMTSHRRRSLRTVGSIRLKGQKACHLSTHAVSPSRCDRTAKPTANAHAVLEFLIDISFASKHHRITRISNRYPILNLDGPSGTRQEPLR